MDQGWTEAKEPWERLRWARLQHYSTAEDAAASLAMKPGTYRAYERPADSSKSTDLDDQRAAQFARKFKVSWLWLLRGEGTPFNSELNEFQSRVLQAMQGQSEDEQARIAAAVEALFRKAG